MAHTKLDSKYFKEHKKGVKIGVVGRKTAKLRRKKLTDLSTFHIKNDRARAEMKGTGSNDVTG